MYVALFVECFSRLESTVLNMNETLQRSVKRGEDFSGNASNLSSRFRNTHNFRIQRTAIDRELQFVEAEDSRVMEVVEILQRYVNATLEIWRDGGAHQLSSRPHFLENVVQESMKRNCLPFLLEMMTQKEHILVKNERDFELRYTEDNGGSVCITGKTDHLLYMNNYDVGIAVFEDKKTRQEFSSKEFAQLRSEMMYELSLLAKFECIPDRFVGVMQRCFAWAFVIMKDGSWFQTDVVSLGEFVHGNFVFNDEQCKKVAKMLCFVLQCADSIAAHVMHPIKLITSMNRLSVGSKGDENDDHHHSRRQNQTQPKLTDVNPNKSHHRGRPKKTSSKSQHGSNTRSHIGPQHSSSYDKENVIILPLKEQYVHMLPLSWRRRK